MVYVPYHTCTNCVTPAICVRVAWYVPCTVLPISVFWHTGFQWVRHTQRGYAVKAEHGYKRDVYVRNHATRTVGIIRDVNDATYPPLCRVYYGCVYGNNITAWSSARELDILSDDDKRIPLDIRRKHGKGSPVLHVDATGKTRAQVGDYITYMRKALRSTYVSHLERMRKTKHRHPIGEWGEFYPYAGPHVDTAPSSPAMVVSHDTCYTWSGYTDPYYTIQFLDGSLRKWVRGSQIEPYTNSKACVLCGSMHTVRPYTPFDHHGTVLLCAACADDTCE